MLRSEKRVKIGLAKESNQPMAAWFVALLLVLFSPTVVATDYFFKPALAGDAGHAYAGLVTGDNLVLGDDVATAIPLTPESLSDRIISNRKSPTIDLVSIIFVGTNVFPLKDPVYVRRPDSMEPRRILVRSSFEPTSSTPPFPPSSNWTPRPETTTRRNPSKCSASTVWIT